MQISLTLFSEFLFSGLWKEHSQQSVKDHCFSAEGHHSHRCSITVAKHSWRWTGQIHLVLWVVKFIISQVFPIYAYSYKYDVLSGNSLGVLYLLHPFNLHMNSDHGLAKATGINKHGNMGDNSLSLKSLGDSDRVYKSLTLLLITQHTKYKIEQRFNMK